MTNNFNSNKQTIKAIIFDWAGTTVDYGSCAPVNAFIELFKRRGIQISMSDVREPMGSNKKEHIQALTRIKSVRSQWHTLYGQLPTESDIDQMYFEFTPIQREIIAESTELIPGTLETIQKCREMGIKIGSTTGYNREIMDILAVRAAKLGYKPDSIVCASDVPEGRPAPWMALKSAMELKVYPMSAIVKVGDTILDIEEGLNAGMWTIGVVKTGNELGLTQDEVESLHPNILDNHLYKISDRFHDAGAHYVISDINDVPDVLSLINEDLKYGVLPGSER